jgi:hypothetical protein
VTDESDQLWCVEYDIVEKGYRQVVKLRGIDAGHEVVQIFAGPLEQKKKVRTGRTERVEGGGRRLAGLGQDRGDSNASVRRSRLVKAERAVTIM